MFAHSGAGFLGVSPAQWIQDLAVAPGQHCSITISLPASLVTSLNGNLFVYSDAPGSPLNVQFV